MRIVFLIQDCTTIGGTERVTCCMASEMARQGHDVSVISVFGMGGECKFEMDERVRFVVASGEKYDLELSKLARLRRVYDVARRMKKNELLLAADVIVAQKFFAAMLSVKSGFGRKTLIGDHYTYTLYRRPLRDFRDFVYRKAAAVVVLTEGNAAQYRAHGLSRVEVIPNMLPIKTAEHLGEGTKEIIAVGRLTYQKGFDTLVQVIAEIKEKIAGWHLTIYGEGEDRPMLERMISEKGLKGIITLYGATDNVSKAYCNASFGIMSSRFEGFPMVLLEAAATGLPMVSFDCPTGPSDIYRNGGGIIVADQDGKALGEAIVRLTEDAELRKKLCSETAGIREKYSEENIYLQWIDAIDRNINK